MLLLRGLPYCEAARARMQGGLPGVVAGGASAASPCEPGRYRERFEYPLCQGVVYIEPEEPGGCFRLADSRKGFALCMPASLKRAAIGTVA